MQPSLVAKPGQPTGDPLGPDRAGIEAEGDGGAPSGIVNRATNPRSARVKWPRLRLNTYLLASTSRAGVQVFSLLGVLLAVSSIDIATFGAYSVAWVSAVISNTLIYTGFYHYLLRCVDVDQEKHTVFWVILALGFLFAGGMAAVGHFLSADVGGSLGLFLLVYAPIPLLAAPAAWCEALLVRDGRVAAVGILTLIAEVLGFAVLSAGLYMGYGLHALLAWRLVAGVANLATTSLLYRGLPRFRFSRAALRRAWHAAWPLQGNVITTTLANYGADFLLTGYLSTAAAGAYRAASRLSTTSTDIIVQPLRSITWSLFGRQERSNDIAAMRVTYLEQLRFLAFLAWPILTCLALFSERAFHAFLKPEWAVAGPTLSVLALARLFHVLEFFVEPALACRGKARLFFHFRMSLTALLLVGIVVVARYGPLAVAQWQAGINTLGGLIAAILVRSALNLRIAPVLRAAGMGLLMAIVCAIAAESAFHFIELPERLRLIVAAAAFSFTLLAGFQLLRRKRLLRIPSL
jgi:O-antigen/teichoic acid export membrane protein